MAELEAWRMDVRDWLAANCPDAMREPVRSADDHVWGGRRWVFASEAQRLWLERMAAKGWTAPEWPVEYGGAGLSPEAHAVLREEMARTDARHLEFQSGQAATPVTINRNTKMTPNGNNVDMDFEMAELAKNQLWYNAVTERVNGKFSSLRSVINEGR